MNFLDTLRDIANEQTDDNPTHDAILSVDIGGGNTQKYRGRIVVDDDVVSLFPTRYICFDKPHTAEWPDFTIPSNATDVFHSEIPLHIRASHVIVAEWAVNDYAKHADR